MSTLNLENAPCQHFDNYHSKPECDAMFVALIKEDDKGRYLKPERCRNLKEIKDC